MDYLTDAHALLWHMFDPGRLGATAQALFHACDSGQAQVAVPALVVAEMLMVVERGRLPGVTMPQLLVGLAALRASDNYILLALDPDTVISSHAFAVIPDIFDRLITAEANHLGLPLINRDATIRDSGLVPVIWD